MIHSNNIVSFGYGSNTDHLFVGLDNNAVATKMQTRDLTPGSLIINYARMGKSNTYLCNIGICTAEYNSVPSSEDIWEGFTNATVHPVMWYNEMPIAVDKNEAPIGTFSCTVMPKSVRAELFEMLEEKIS